MYVIPVYVDGSVVQLCMCHRGVCVSLPLTDATMSHQIMFVVFDNIGGDAAH